MGEALVFSHIGHGQYFSVSESENHWVLSTGVTWFNLSKESLADLSN